jgi:hypothetical protein
MAVVNFSSITFSGIKSEIERFLREEHNKAGILFSPASPYGHILSVIENLHQLSIFYLKTAINQFDLSDPNSSNPRIIRNAAIFAGHNPGRAISATGTLRLSLKSTSDIEKDIPGSRITFNNRTQLKNNTNSLDYSLNLGTDTVTHRIIPNYNFFIPIIQGKWSTKTFTGDGTELQSISVSELGRKDVENFNVEVVVNGDVWSVKKHIFDMLPEEKACVIRTGFNGGVDIVFGNGGFGEIPRIGSIIQVSYLVTDGSTGNIFRRTRNDWKFIGDVIDGNGETIDPAQVFNIDIFTDINFGADAESILFTKNILPIVSNNFVLGLPQQYAYEIKKLGVFSHVNAYEKTGTIFIVATPNVRLFKNQNADYFTIDIRAFELDRYEKSKIDKYLKTSGNIQLTRKYRIDSPKLSFYVMNIFVIPYSDATDDSVNAQILDRISEYFLDLKRIDRIPKLDIIRELSSIRDIHSVDVQFICKKNEDYHIENMSIMKNSVDNFESSYNTDISIKKSTGYNPKEVLGIDPILGDILFEPEELPVIRGGWYDRNGIYYSSDIDGNQMKSVNIIKKGTIDSKNRPNT